MKQVLNKTLYHCNSASTQNPYELLSVGDTITIGEKLNPFMGSYEISAPSIIEDTNALLSAITFYWHYSRETVIEEVRKSINQELPSRHECLWVGDYNTMSNWKLHFKKNRPQLLELSLTGTLFKCDATFIEGNPIPLIELRARAEKYWKGRIVDPSKVEYLFIGKAHVMNVL